MHNLNKDLTPCHFKENQRECALSGCYCVFGFPEDIYLHGSVVFLHFFGRKGQCNRAVLSLSHLTVVYVIKFFVNCFVKASGLMHLNEETKAVKTKAERLVRASKS